MRVCLKSLVCSNFCWSKQDGFTFPVIYVHFWSHGTIMEQLLWPLTFYILLEHHIAADLYEMPEMLICMWIKGHFRPIIINFQVTCFTFTYFCHRTITVAKKNLIMNSVAWKKCLKDLLAKTFQGSRSFASGTFCTWHPFIFPETPNIGDGWTEALVLSDAALRGSEKQNTRSTRRLFILFQPDKHRLKRSGVFTVDGSGNEAFDIKLWSFTEEKVLHHSRNVSSLNIS